MCRTVDFYGPWRSYLEIAAEKIKKACRGNAEGWLDMQKLTGSGMISASSSL